MHIIDDLSRAFLTERSPGVERAGDVYGPQDSAVASGVETAAEDFPETRPELFDNRRTWPEGTVAGPFPLACFLRAAPLGRSLSDVIANTNSWPPESGLLRYSAKIRPRTARTVFRVVGSILSTFFTSRCTSTV